MSKLDDKRFKVRTLRIHDCDVRLHIMDTVIMALAPCSPLQSVTMVLEPKKAQASRGNEQLRAEQMEVLIHEMVTKLKKEWKDLPRYVKK